MADSGISFSREYEMPVYYKNQQIGTRRVDFLVEENISVELKAIIKSFKALGITDYDGGLDPSSLGSNLDYALILNSGSMHLTIDHMIQSNSEINSEIPDKAKADIYGFNDILIKDEITNFILASQAFTG